MQRTATISIEHEPGVNAYRELVRKAFQELDQKGLRPNPGAKQWFKTQQEVDEASGKVKTSLTLECNDDILIDHEVIRSAELRLGETGNIEVVTDGEIFHLAHEAQDLIEWLYEIRRNDFNDLGFLRPVHGPTFSVDSKILDIIAKSKEGRRVS